MTTDAATTARPQCRAFVHDGSLPSNTSQTRQCRNHTDGAKFCAIHKWRAR